MTKENSLTTAVALAKAATETAQALASAKTQSDIVAAVMANDISHMKGDLAEIKSSIGSISSNFVTITDWKETKAESTADRVDLRTSIEKLQEGHGKLKEFQDTLNGKMIAWSTLAGTVAGGLSLVISHYWH